MDYDDLLELLELESVGDLAYFEQYAELVESEEDISQDAFLQFFEEVEQDTLQELTDGYFEELLRVAPDTQHELYSLLDTIGRTLSGLAATLDAEGNRQVYGEEFVRFRNWYLFDSEVTAHPVGAEDSAPLVVPVCEAISLARSENLTDNEYRFDFSDALSYTIDEYIMPLSALESAYDDEEDDEDYRDPYEDD
ncbi:MAG: hypothetical protein LBR14_00120 [Clostridiales Family XIII bacterium]|jgi:hypothetical protein|nr:hypothetical protein [Clostridiales Family XIII bacterium]